MSLTTTATATKDEKIKHQFSVCNVNEKLLNLSQPGPQFNSIVCYPVLLSRIHGLSLFISTVIVNCATHIGLHFFYIYI